MFYNFIKIFQIWNATQNLNELYLKKKWFKINGRLTSIFGLFNKIWTTWTLFILIAPYKAVIWKK